MTARALDCLLCALTAFLYLAVFVLMGNYILDYPVIYCLIAAGAVCGFTAGVESMIRISERLTQAAEGNRAPPSPPASD